MSKNALQSKTILFNLFIAAFAVLADNTGLLRSSLSDSNYLLLMMVVSCINIYLRSVTSTPVKLK